MKITILGHAGALIEARNGITVMCDPWFGPAYHAGWFPFPDNAWLRPELTRSPDFVYASHSHPDHFDAAFCSELDPETIVLLPAYPLNELEELLRKCGLTKFRRMEHGVTRTLKGVDFTVLTDVSPLDGPMGDSALLIDDGETRVFNRNDARPRDSRRIEELGPYDVHLGQHSGAVWFPAAYRMPPKIKRAMSIRKRKNQLDRFLNYDAVAKATFSVPNSGPPAFLDDDLFALNDLGDPASVYADQSFAMQHLGPRGRLMLPGSVAEVTPDSWREVDHPMNAQDVFGAKKLEHLKQMQARERPRIEEMWSTLRRVDGDLYDALEGLLGHLLLRSDRIALGIGGNVVIDWGDDAMLLDFVRGRVSRWRGEQFLVRHLYDKSILEEQVASGLPNWVDDFWSGCRVEIERKGPYNDYVNAFFRCLSEDRLDYAENWLAERSQQGDAEWVEQEGWRFQRYCPHARADLSRVGQVEGDLLVCTQHGLRFDLKTGRCLDAADLKIRTEAA